MGFVPKDRTVGIGLLESEKTGQIYILELELILKRKDRIDFGRSRTASRA